MSTKAFLWSLANLLLVAVFGALVGANMLHAWGLPIGIVVGMLNYHIGKRAIKAGLMR